MVSKTFKLNKLVRDGIVSSTEAQGGKVVYRVLKKDDKVKALIKKISEELDEFDESKDSTELGQVYGVLLALAKEFELNEKDLKKIEEKRKFEVGGFDKGIFIETITLPAQNKWAKYYSKDPVRYPEVND